MLLGDPAPTPYDLYFQIKGIPVRIHPMFWMGALILGFHPGVHPLTLIMWVMVVLISILVHEFGHALLMERFGQSPHVVLYMLGGYAADGGADPYGQSAWRFSSVRSRSGASSLQRQVQRIIILLGGPGAGFLLAGLVVLFIVGTGGTFRLVGNLPLFWQFRLGVGTYDTHQHLYELVHMLLFVNILWGLINLLPVYPLDGGQICRELLVMYQPWQGVLWSSYISFAVALGLAIVGLSNRNIFLALLFGLLAFQSYQAIQQTTGRGGGYGGRPW